MPITNHAWVFLLCSSICPITAYNPQSLNLAFEARDHRMEAVRIAAGSKQRDVKALLALYWATGGPQWKHSWDLTADVADWYRVDMDGEGRVVSLLFAYNNLRGERLSLYRLFRRTTSKAI